jgi:hypothetical protein
LYNFELFQWNVFILLLRRTSHLNKCSYLEIRCFQSCSMNECSQSLPFTVLRNTHSKILRNLELFKTNVFKFLFRKYTQPHSNQHSNYCVWKRVQLMHTLNLCLLHFTCMFVYNYKSYFILSWYLNSLHILFLNNIHYTYMNTCIVCHSIKQKQIRGIFTIDKAS